ncbi:phage tail protein [Pantoea agglomerans]|uniref:phage tail protein n=1 Tax=Enterobacter agglomerans TaxID=549 RepID=UPI003C7C4570
MADTISVSSKLFKAKLLDYYYIRRAESSIGQGSRFQMVKAYWGKSALVTSNAAGGWNIADIPSTFRNADLAGKFTETPLVLTSTGADISITIQLDDAILPEGKAYDLNTLTLVDGDGNAFAVLCLQQDSVFRGKAYRLIVTIEQKTA